MPRCSHRINPTASAFPGSVIARASHGHGTGPFKKRLARRGRVADRFGVVDAGAESPIISQRSGKNGSALAIGVHLSSKEKIKDNKK
jgi:hypothetical protein